MKTWIKAGVIGILGVTLVHAEQTKLYDVESGKVSYEIKGSGNTMGVTTKSLGKKHLLFDAYGSQSLTEENKVEKTVVMGQTQTNKAHTMVYFKEGIMYIVDFDEKNIVRQENPMAMMGGNMAAKGKAMMKQMGGKQIGYDKVLGYRCEVWEVMGTKQCIYKGVPLKVESNMMGIKHTETATKAEFDISVDKEDFKLPDFPISDDMGTAIDRNRLGKMDASTQKEAQQMQMMMGMMAAAAQDAGVQPGQRADAGQEQAMLSSMKNAMFPMMKEEILSEEQSMRFAQECLTDADTLSEANRCNQKLNEMTGEDEPPLSSWNSQMKEESLQEINHYLNVIIPCVKKAQTVNTLEQCMR